MKQKYYCLLLSLPPSPLLSLPCFSLAVTKCSLILLQVSFRHFESSWPLPTLWSLLLVLCLFDAQAWKWLCRGTEASCGGRGIGWWRWRCGGCLLPLGQLCLLWLRLLWTGDLKCFYNCSNVAVGRRANTIDTSLLFRRINHINKHRPTKVLRTCWVSWDQTWCYSSGTRNVKQQPALGNVCMQCLSWASCHT